MSANLGLALEFIIAVIVGIAVFATVMTVSKPIFNAFKI